MQICDFVRRNGRCADSCRFYEVPCLDARPSRSGDRWLAALAIVIIIAAVLL